MAVARIDNLGGGGGIDSHIYDLGTGTSFNIASLFPNDYQNLTVGNFIVEAKNASCSGSQRIEYSRGWSQVYPSGSFSVSKSYNANTGLLTVSASISGGYTSTGGVGSASSSAAVKPKVYLVIGNIESA